MSEAITVTQQPDRFAVDVDGATAGFTQFVERDGRRIFFHTEIGDEFGGRGLASTLVRQALDTTRQQGVRVVPVCPYVKGWIEKHPDYADLVEQPTREDLDAVHAVAD